MNARKHHVGSTLALSLSLIALPILSYGATMATTVTPNGDGSFTIVQKGSAVISGDGASFEIKKLDSIPGFSEGILSSVFIQLEHSWEAATVSVTNFSAESFTGSANSAASVTTSFPAFLFSGAPTIDGTFQPLVESFFTNIPLVSKNLENVVIAPSEVVTEVGLAGSATQSKDIISGVVDQYGGLGSFIFQFQNTFNSVGTALGGGMSVDLNTGASTFDVTVTYSAIPEPSTYALIFGGIAVVALLFRRRKVA